MKTSILPILFLLVLPLLISGMNAINEDPFSDNNTHQYPPKKRLPINTIGNNISLGHPDLFHDMNNASPDEGDAGGDIFVFAGNDTTICLSTDSIVVNGYAENYHFVSWANMGDGFFYNPTNLNTAYVPGPQDIALGKANLYLIGISAPPDYVRVVDSLIITIVPVPECFAGHDATICNGDTYVLQGIASNSPGIFWSTLGDGSFDDVYSLTATYTPGGMDLDIGYSHLTLTALENAPCVLPVMNTFILSYFNAPVADAGQDTLICNGESLQLEANAEWFSQIYWTTAGDGTFSDPGVMNPIYYPGEHDSDYEIIELSITLDPIWPCSAVAIDTLELALQVSPAVSVGQDQTVCENDAVTCTSQAENYAEIVWLAIGGNGFFDNPHILNPVYTLGEHEISSGILYLMLCATPVSPCILSVSDYFEIEIEAQAEVNAGEDVVICSSDSVVLGSEAINYSGLFWETTGDGTFDDNEILSPVYFPGTQDIVNGSTALFITASPIAPCISLISDTLSLLIQSPAMVEAGEDITICNTASLTGFAENYSAVFWSTSGDGSFSDPELLNPDYFPGNQDLETLDVSLTFNANSLNPCDLDAFDVILVTIDYPQVISSNLQEKNLAVGETLSFSFVTESISEGSYSWFLNGIELENFNSSELFMQSVSPVNAGNYNCIFSNDCFQISSDTVMISVFAEALQTLQFHDGWNAVSSYIFPINSDMDVILNPIIQDLVILFNSDGVYWPGQDIFTFLNWTPNTGYMVKTTETINLTIVGFKKYPQDPVILPSGWSVLPVNSSCPLQVVELFSGHPDILMIKEVGGYNIYWPEMGINTLESINPGKAYEIFNASDNDISIAFPGCESQ